MTDNAPPLRLYLLTQTEVTGYDTYDSAVVCAESEENARHIHPATTQDAWYREHRPGEPLPNRWSDGTWADDPDLVTARFIGTAAPGTERGVILASFNAG